MIAVCIVVAILFLYIGNKLHGTHAQPSAGHQPAQVGDQSTQAAGSPAQPSNSITPICATFSMAGAICDLPLSGSGWIRKDSSAPSGVHYCWPKDAKFKEIWYLGADGQKTLWDPEHPNPVDVEAMMFIPFQPMSFSYNLAQTCAS
jgi:hypothetical protein